MSMMKPLVAGIVSLAVCWMAGGASPPQATVWPSAEWQVATPESVGLDSTRLKEGLELVHQRGWRVDSIQVVRHGKLVLDAYFYPYGPGHLHDLRSATKSVTSSLLGLSIAQGKWPDVNVPVLSQFPERKFEAVDARKKAMTLGNLVDMRSGLSWFEVNSSSDEHSSFVQMYRTKDWFEYVLNQPMIWEPGGLFLYSGGNMDVLAALIGRAWHQPAREVAREKLFRPIGISRFEWAGADPDGNTTGDGTLGLTPRDMARLGLLWLHDGVWKDERLLPEGWTGKLFVDGAGLWATGGYLYKRGFWIDSLKGCFRAWGRHGQLIMVDPTLDMIVVVTSKVVDSEANTSMHVANEIMHMASETRNIPENPSAQAELGAMLQKIAQPLQLHEGPSEIPTGWCGKTWTLEKNPLGFVSMRLEPDPVDSGSVIIELGLASGKTRRFSCGLDGACRFNPDADNYNGTTAKVDCVLALNGRWAAPDLFELEGQYLESAKYMSYRIEFRNNGIIVNFENNEDWHEVIRSVAESASDSLDKQ